ncbi:hypothetical protein KZP23_12145 [Echinicola marina]|uniref:hypothetical protein n=1 Tax=Echinicola marina TaxID=2859768 RepID=UPI001CF6A09F|nr:hypothetical protein [Echinicola marina]UCS91512.1 hypothetical protein KZP23_12145 [Echinicola marina]
MRFYSVQTCLPPGRSVESPDKTGQAVRNMFTGVITDNHKEYKDSFHFHHSTFQYSQKAL